MTKQSQYDKGYENGLRDGKAQGHAHGYSAGQSSVKESIRYQKMELALKLLSNVGQTIMQVNETMRQSFYDPNDDRR